MYRLSKKDIELLLSSIKKDYKLTSDLKNEIKNYLELFETSDEILYGNFGNYETKVDGYNGLYGYLKDRIEGYLSKSLPLYG